MTNTKRLLIAIIMSVAVIGLDKVADALKAPHDPSRSVNCSQCHTRGGFKTRTSFDNLCFNTLIGCHRASAGASLKRLSKKDASNRFASLPSNWSTTKQSSHGWKVPNVNSNAGVTVSNSLTEKYPTTKIYCTRCHRVMGDSQGPYKKFLRADPTGDYICLNCHSSRRVSNVREPLPASISFAGSRGETITVAPHYSHPVEVNYSTARAAKPDFYQTSFRLATGYLESARVRLYTTHQSAEADGGSRLTGKNNGAVVCQTCHGPIHSADSNPYTLDNLTTYSKQGKYSSSAGNLLRQYPIAGPKASNNLCLSCHKVQAHKGFLCGRCHTPHKKAGENNRYLILENISTPSSGRRSVAFTSRSEMAARGNAGYTSTQPRTVRQASTRICQVCHMNTKFHRNYSSPGGTVSRTHNLNVDGDPSQKYRFCPDCHKHTSGFTPSGCGTCHNFPPADIINSTDSFKHGKHTNGGVEPGQSANTFWKTGTVTDNRSASSYGFSCGRCHSPWAPYTAPGGDGYTGKNHYGIVSPSNNYTTDIGFKIRTSSTNPNPLPWNPLGTYLYNGTGRALDGTSTKWWGAGATAECRNLYCHGQWYNGYTSNNPQARGTQPCGSCHGASKTNPPGNTGGAANNYGAHPRHVGSANNQQYGSGTPNFRCNACHSLTSKYNNETTVSSRKYHVNGRVNINFDTGAFSGFTVADANSKYGIYNDYTSRRPKMSVRPAYTTCSLIYCHSRGNRTQGNYSAPNNAGIGAGNGRFPNWSSSSSGNFTTTMNIGGYTMKTRCARCHGNTTYKGITMAMPNYTGTLYGGAKENSHRKHVIDNKFRCNICHSSTVNSANNAIANTQNHVNRFYNISIISTYRDNGVGNNYDNSAKKCSSVKCHAGKTTPAWGSKIGCADCHLNNAGDYNKRIVNKQPFQNFSEAAPKIYSAAWAGSGHGRPASSGDYYGKNSEGNSNGNAAAGKTCTNCHKASVPHNLASNPFRLYTLRQDGNPNALCEDCHGLNPGNTGAPQPSSKARGIQTHASSVVGSIRYNFAIKCIDCHDPHGDNNVLMLHSTVARPRITTGNRRESSDQYGRLLLNITGRAVDFVGNQYSSNYARKYQAARICQACHTQTRNPTDSSKGGRFRWYSTKDKNHGSNKCTNCHSHASGFKGAGCDGCHGFPPTSAFTMISLQTGAKGKRASSSVTSGAHGKHTTIFGANPSTCSKCHFSGMWDSGSESGNIDIEFRAFTDYSGASQKYYGQIAVKNGYYGYSGVPGIKNAPDDTQRCDVKCHGAKGKWLSSSFDTNTAGPSWSNPSTAKCGKCHGAKKAAGQGSWPISNRHAKHAGAPGTGYDFMCRLCHADTVMGTATTLNKTNHVNGEATFRFYTGTFTGNRVWSGSAYNGGDTKVNSGFGRCENLYCHSRGTKTLQPYTGIAFPNYTARWDLNISAWNNGEKCSLCHGSKKTAGGYAGITSAMPNQANQAHKKHVVDNGFKCYFCHSATVNDLNEIVSITNHVNKFKNISIISSYRTGQTMYSSSLSSTNKTCKNVRCHAGRKTPNWTVSYGTISCPDCHYSNTSDTDNFAWTNFSGNNSVAARIYSTEWTKRGHGKSTASGKYAFSNNSGAGKICTNCHKPAVQHGASNNYFRLYTSNSDRLCMSCHGRGTQLNAWGQGFSDITGIQSHTWANISTNGYLGGSNKANANGGWNITPKCVDCHDPHGDKNNYMIHSFINMSGSDSLGRPTATQPMDTNLMNFTAVGGPQMNWSSYVRSDFKGICQRCHSDMTAQNNAMINFNKATYSGHNRGKRCTDCHKHKKGFAPSGCDSCHDYPPPKAPTTLGWPNSADDMSNMSSLHIPHAWNKKQRPGIPLENDVNSAGGKPANERGYYCYRCHAGAIGGNGQSSDHGTDYPTKQNATMTNLTMLNGKWSPGALAGGVSVTDDTCWNVKCHTPRYYTRQWKKPTDCDDCHGYRNKTAGETFKIQTTGSHKIHVNYSTPGIAGTDFKKYGLRCSNCHYNWQALNNYSTHYSSYVNITANGPVNTRGGQFYGRGREFKGFTTGGELNNDTNVTCSKVYCHGNFTNGTTKDVPKWRKGAMTTTCISCHKGKLTGGDGSGMPERHPKHVSTYSFPCVRCHVRTAGNITTVIFNYSSHVNGRKDVYFDSVLPNAQATFNSSGRFCSDLYCHSKGARSAGASFTTRTTLANYTANWNLTVNDINTKTGNRPCSFCHGNKTYNGITAAMPNYTANWGNSHRTHVIGNKFRCNVCHSATVNAAGTINYAGGNHVNGFKNITIIAAYKSGLTLYSTNATATKKMTCKNVKCHALKTTPKWGTSANCKNCHFIAAGSDTDNYADFRNFSGTAAKIYSTEWASKGHGSVGKDIQCTNCHNSTAPHDGKDGSGNMKNPYRLWTSQSVALCGNCHGGSTERNNPQWGGYIASVYQDIKPHTRAETNGNAAWNTHSTAQGRSVKCIDCHDPHGDKNRKMIHALINMSGSDRFGRPKGRPWGDGSDSTVTAQMTFTSHGASGGQIIWSSFANGNLSRSICRRCHTPNGGGAGQDPFMGDQPSPNFGEQTKDNYAVDHQPSHGSKCTSCHQHTKGFKGAKCDACHGFPPTGMFNLISGDSTRSNENRTPRSSSSQTPGAHGRHSSILLQGQAGGTLSTLCNFCHSGGMSTTGSEDSNITIRFGAAGTFAQYTVGLYKGQTAVKNGYYDYSGYPGMKSTTGTKRCENVKCHGAQGNWLTKSFGTPTAPRWDDTTRSTVFCGSCHGAKKSTTVAPTNTWPTTKAHALHAGTDAAKQQNLMCRVCHGSTVLGTATTLSKSNHVNAAVLVKFTTEGRVDGNSAYLSGGTEVNATFGKCWNTYCHSKGTKKFAPYTAAAGLMNFTATWNDAGQRGSYRKGNGQKAKCNYCHGNKSWSGVTSAMPNYNDGTPKANKHPKHVREYSFLCANCHVKIVANNTSIQGGNYSLHVNRAYNVDLGDANTNTRSIDNSMGRYTSTNSGCRLTYCHSRGSDFGSYVQPNYTAHWGDNRLGYKQAKANMAKCNYCHGSRNTYSGMTSAMPNYVNLTPKANRHPMHVTKYGFSCTVCHDRVTANSTSIDASGGSDLHVNKIYNVDFNKDVPGRSFINNSGAYTYDSVAPGSKCKNTYCHSRGTDFTKPYNTRTSFANWTARWGDDRGSYKQANGLKAKCNYCHGNRRYSGMTSAMPNYSGNVGARTAKANSHKKHVVDNGFVCSTCHYGVVPNNTSISDRSRHMNGFYNISITPAKKDAGKGYSSVYGPSGGFCKNNKCHGASTPQWGNPSTANCKICHFSTGTSDMDNYAQADGTKAEIYSSEWKRKGHGQFAAFTSTNTVRCLRCHNSGVGHNNASNPFRLLTSESISLCGNCHGKSTERNKWNTNGEYVDIQLQTAKDIATHTEKATGGDASWNTHSTIKGKGVKCIDCHDPHGDKNKKMVHEFINHSGSDNFGRPAGRPWGIGQYDINNRAQMTFTSFGGQIVWSSFASQNLSRSICRRCHTPNGVGPGQDPNMGNAPVGNEGNQTKSNYAAGHQTSHNSKCTSCHTHANGFKGGACNGCHGFPPTGMFNLISGDSTRSNEIRTPKSSSSATPGAHGRHTTILLPGTAGGNDLKAVCSYCHSGGMADSSNDDGRITFKFKAFGYYTGSTQKYQGQSAVRNGYYGYSSSGIAKPGNDDLTCNVKCHGARGSWLTKAYGPSGTFGTPSSPKWSDKNSVFCGSCHGAKKAASTGSYPTTYAHPRHAGWGGGQYNVMCRNCHGITVLGTATTLSKTNHVNGAVYVKFTSEARVDGFSKYTAGDTVVNSGFGKCLNTYCHSKGTKKVAPYNVQADLMNFTATWTQTRGSYKNPKGTAAKCNYCHGNKNYAGVTSAMPEYADGTPKANKHPKHVRTYNFLCVNCHMNTTRNNSSIDAPNGTSNHVNRAYNINFTSVVRGGSSINNSLGRYTSINSGCRLTYCHSKGSDFVNYVQPNYTAHWGDNRLGYKQDKALMAKCNYCHGSRNTYSGMTSAMPNYVNLTPKANRHPMHVTKYGFSCTVCHAKVTSNSTSIDASGGSDLHVNKVYNVNFNQTVPGRFNNNTGAYTYLGTGQGSKCKNTYCHSRGTDRVPPYNTWTSLSNYTAQWGDTRGTGGYKQAAGQKAKCNYCHGNRLFSGTTSAMPNYSSAATNTAKWNTHPIHVRSYGFTCNVCHVKVVANNTSISDSSLHVNQVYNINFKANVRGNLTNNTGVYSYTDLTTKNKCKNTYCHSRGTDFTAPFNTRTSFANWTARWGDSRGGYKQANGLKAKCNYCHGNRAYSGMTSAMPNYSGTTGAGYGVTAKANSHKKHVVDNGFVCSTCHYGVVPNNTSISDRANHVNGFYNISITPERKNAGKGYSSVYGPSGGFCKNNKCHGTSTPKWGDPSTANCKTCHLGSADIDDFAQNNGIKTELSSSEWGNKGHGKFAPFTSTNAVRCYRCHNSGVGHNSASNPYRLYTSDPTVLCLSCHGVSTEISKSWGTDGGTPNAQTYTDIVTHSKAATGGDAAWNTHSSTRGREIKCIDCHDPHGDKNRKMIHALINMSGSDKFGRPLGRPWTGNPQPTVTAMMTFTAHGASGGQLIWSSFANGNASDGSRAICRRCHTPNGGGAGQDPNMGNKPTGQEGNMTKGNYAASHQSHTDTCTAACHTHKSGFKGGGESSGDTDCKTCHGSGDLLEKMQATNNYHHVMMNTSATGSTKYPNKTSFGPGDQKNSARKCLMCHVDHNVFRPDINNDGTGGRAKNLRWSVLAQGNKTGINTDFWPAKRKNATGRTGADANSGNYSSTYPIYGPSQYNGVCMSCHKNVQDKNTTLVNQFKVKQARNFSVALYTSSSHNFQVISGIFVFGSSGRSSFRGNCVKCHRTPNPNGNYGSLSKPAAQQNYGRFPVALHDKNVPSLLMNIATSSLKPEIEQLCFNCHDNASRGSGGPGSMDYYSSIKMNSGAKMIKAAITGKRYNKPIEDIGMAGMHKIDEYYKAVTSVNENSNPSVLWNYSTGAAGGVGRHIECVDCHNTHGGNASIRRTVGAPFRGALQTGQALFNYTASKGNMIAGAQQGVWGVRISYSNGVSYRGQTPQFKKVAQVTYQYEVCLKCHSRYAYGTNPPGVPDGLPDPAGTTVLAYDNLGADVPQADISRMINPNNYGYHPIFRKGRNQPPKTANSNWPSAKSNWMYKDRFNNKTAFISVSGLSWNFVPPFSQHSLLACTDCHVADNTNKAAQRFKPNGAPSTTGTWGVTATLANIEKIDGALAVASTTGATLQTDVIVDGSNPGPSPEELWVVAIGKTTAGTAAGKKQTLGAFYGAMPGGTSLGTMSPTQVPFGGAIGRIDSKVTAWTGAWTDFETNTYSAKITTGSVGTVSIDYIGLEGVYTMTAEVRGPHGSMQRWILTDVDRDIWFDANNNGTLDVSTADRINSSVPASGADGDIFEGSTVFCWNCHRRDLYYSTPTIATYTRVSHASGNMENLAFSTKNQWGIACMNCHAGGGIGEIHGSFATSTTNFPGMTTRSVLGRPRGVRLLNGAMFNFNPGTLGCYTPNGTATPYAAACSGGHVGDKAVGATNYSYTSW